MNLRRNKPLPQRPARPALDAEEKLRARVDWAVSQLAQAVLAYADEPDQLTPQMRADEGARFAFEELVKALTGVHSRLDPTEGDARPLYTERHHQILFQLVLGYGIPALLSDAADIAEFRGGEPLLAVMAEGDRAQSWVATSATIALAGVE